MLTAHSCSTYFSLFLCGIDTWPFPRKTLSCVRGVPLLFLSCEGAQRLQSVKDRRPDVVGGKGAVSVQCILKATGSGAASSSLESRRLRQHPMEDHHHTPIRLKLAGIAATAAQPETDRGHDVHPPQARWNRGDCGDPRPLLHLTSWTASSSLESRRLRLVRIHQVALPKLRLKLAGIAATAASGLRQSRATPWPRLKLAGIAATAAWRGGADGAGVYPPQARWNRGDCGSVRGVYHGQRQSRLKLAGIAATAATLPCTSHKPPSPPQARWNRGDCGPSPPAKPFPAQTASSSLESRRLRQLGYVDLPETEEPPQARWNRGDCGLLVLRQWRLTRIRLKLAGIAATAALRRRRQRLRLSPASSSLESRRLRLNDTVYA